MSCCSTLPLIAYESIESSGEESDCKQSNVGLVWFKNTDLRIHDNAALLNAHKSCDEVIHLMVVDPFWFTDKTRLLAINKTGPFRCNFLREAIDDLRRTLKSMGSELVWSMDNLFVTLFVKWFEHAFYGGLNRLVNA